MQNLMITHGGALGDNGFTIPALVKLRERYNKIYLFSREQAVTALKDTGLIDKFIVSVLAIDMDKASKEQNRNWLNYMTKDIDFHATLKVSL